MGLWFIGLGQNNGLPGKPHGVWQPRGGGRLHSERLSAPLAIQSRQGGWRGMLALQKNRPHSFILTERLASIPGEPNHPRGRNQAFQHGVGQSYPGGGFTIGLTRMPLMRVGKTPSVSLGAVAGWKRFSAVSYRCKSSNPASMGASLLNSRWYREQTSSRSHQRLNP